MIVVVEGPSASGKTTWIADHQDGAAVIGEARRGSAPRREDDPAAAAAYWAKVDAGRWAAACQAEQRAGIALCDTDPFKLHYVWCLWQTGNAAARQWRTEMNAIRGMFSDERLGIADLILVSFPDPGVLAARRSADASRRRRPTRAPSSPDTRAPARPFSTR
jgi:nicotinamide riboside kinase